MASGILRLQTSKFCEQCPFKGNDHYSNFIIRLQDIKQAIIQFSKWAHCQPDTRDFQTFVYRRCLNRTALVTGA